MRTIRVGIAFGIILLSQVAKGQDAEQKVYKNDIGFSSNIFSGTASPFTFMYKRQLMPRLALRVGMGLQANNSRTEDETTNTQAEVSNSTVVPGLGAEWQNQLSSRWMWYAGADFRMSFGWNKVKQFTFNQALSETNTYTRITTISALAGLRFNILDRLYVATEAYLNASTTDQERNIISFTSATTSTTTTTGNSANLSPAVGVLIFFRF